MMSGQFESLLVSRVLNNPVVTQRGTAWLHGCDTSTMKPARIFVSASSDPPNVTKLGGSPYWSIYGCTISGTS